MAENVSGLINRITKNLESQILEEIKWIRMVRDELKAIEQTLASINRVLPDAQEQQSKNAAIKRWLQDLKVVAMDVEDKIDLIFAQHSCNLKAATLHQRFPGTKRARELKALVKRLDEVDRNRKQFNLQERPPLSHKRSLFWCLATRLVWEKSLDKGVDEVNNELCRRMEDLEYKTLGRPLTLEEAETYHEFWRPTPRCLYLVQNCRAGDNRRR